MEMKNFMRNPYVVLAYCLLFVFLSSHAITLNPSMYIVVFILITIITFLIRPLTESYLKPTCYFLLGTLSYWMIAKELIFSSGGPNPGGPELTIPILFGIALTLVPIIFGLAILNALVALITYSDGQTPGQAFIAGALSLLFLNLPDKYTFLSGVLIFSSASFVVYFTSKLTERKMIAEGVVKAAFLSSSCIYLAAFSQFWTGVSFGVYKIPTAFFFLKSIIYLFAISAFTAWAALEVFDFFLQKLRYIRSMEDGNAKYVRAPAVQEKIEKSQKKKKPPS
jgi:hypothetical protein